MFKHTLSYAQNREDIIIDAFFDAKPTGFYVDVGANHPTENSVTKFFYEKGWRGINIEPNERLIRLLRADRPHDVIVGKGVGAEEKEAVFREYKDADGLSTFSDAMKANGGAYYAAHKNDFTDKKIPVTTLKHIFDDYKVKTIDFMKVDVEGYEYEVLAGNDWGKYKPELICVETNHIIKDWRPILASNGYVKFYNDGLNDYYAPKNSERLRNFSFPDKVLMTYPLIVPFVPHSEQKDINDDEFLEKKASEEERPAIKLQIKWSLLGLGEALHEGFIVEINHNKRRILEARIKKCLQIRGEKGDYRLLRKRYFGFKLFALRIGNLTLTIVERVSNRILRIA